MHKNLNRNSFVLKKVRVLVQLTAECVRHFTNDIEIRDHKKKKNLNVNWPYGLNLITKWNDSVNFIFYSINALSLFKSLSICLLPLIQSLHMPSSAFFHRYLCFFVMHRNAWNHHAFFCKKTYLTMDEFVVWKRR